MNSKSLFGKKNLFNTIMVVSAVVVTVMLLVPLGAIAQQAAPFWLHTGNDVYYNAGNVGIGTASPSAHLHVGDGSYTGVYGGAAIGISGDSSQLVSVNSLSGSSGLMLHNAGAGAWRISLDRTANRIDFANDSAGTPWGGSPSMSINSSGIGIGTTSPAAKLHVAGNIKVDGNIISDGTICIGQCN